MAEGLPPLERELDLPADSVQLQAHLGRHSRRGDGREQNHVLSGLHVEECRLIAELAAKSCARFLGLWSGQTYGDEAPLDLPMAFSLMHHDSALAGHVTLERPQPVHQVDWIAAE